MQRRWARRWGSVLLSLAALWPEVSLSQEWIYTVRPGDTLWHLSEQHLVDVSLVGRLQELNNVSDPMHMPPGLRLRIPIRWLKVQPSPARVAAAENNGGTITRAGAGPTVPLAEGTLLHSGDTVKVSPIGSATIEFADGSELLAGPGSVIRMDALRAYGRGRGMVDTRIRIEEGRTDADVPPAPYSSSAFEVWTPAAVSAVRGTELRVAVDEKGAVSRTEVLAGAAEVRAGARSVRVPKGFGTVTKKGQPPGGPKTLLPAPRLTALPPEFEDVPIRFRIDQVANAEDYRIEIAPTPESIRCCTTKLSRTRRFAARTCQTVAMPCGCGRSIVRVWKGSTPPPSLLWMRALSRPCPCSRSRKGRFARPRPSSAGRCR